jgi:N-acetylmuramic acid 6-phosphate etherase/N-acetylglucosamine-6-phosphate deacetylase
MIISAPRLFSDGAFFQGALVVENGVIVDVLAGPVAADIALDEGVLSPGLIDLHNNGAFGVDCAAPDADWDFYITELAARGVTSVLPTIITAPLPEIFAAAKRVAAAMARFPGIVGLHLEGPFLNRARRGAHRDAWILPPDAAVLLANADLAACLRVITLAPEIPGALAAIAAFQAAGITVSLGHTDADAAQMRAAIGAGARMVTHVFNAQSALNHRAPGAAGVALSDDRMFPCLIVDGVHVDPAVLKIAFAAAGKAVAVTDSILLAGLEGGAVRQFGGAAAQLAADGVGRRPDGTMAGAGITLDEGVRRLIRAGVPPAIALAAATSRPADAIGLTDRGRLVVGQRADLVWWGQDWSVRRVWISGAAKQVSVRALEERGTAEIVGAFLAQETAAVSVLRGAAPALTALAEAVAGAMQAGGRLFYVGAGTSGRLGLLDAVECGPTFGVPAGVIVPILAGGPNAFVSAAEGAEDGTASLDALKQHGFSSRDALVGIAASGSTPFTLAALDYARSVGAVTGAVICKAGSAMEALAEFPVVIPTGAEVIGGSTRLSAGTVTKIALNTLSSTVMIRLGKTYGPFMVDMRPSNAKLRRRAVAMTVAISGCDEAAARAALAAAGWHVKVAIVMLAFAENYEDAKKRLDETKGSLRAALAGQH